ncbi:hypothetical protein [Streptomyces sp. NPDC048242]|uniref:hypothetical protein n=1 Tax=Streptomyces sp. NPDC048242 TaxID=3155026 RepID=UPI003440C712
MSTMDVTWLACDLKSGRIAEELQSLTASGPVGRRLGVSASGQFDLDLNGAPPDWEAATDPGRTMLVPVDSSTGQPLGAWITLTREGGSDPTLQLGAATPECYLDRRYTGSYSGIGQDQAAIMTGVGTAVAVDAPPFVFDAPATGRTMDYDVQDGDDRTILSVWQELMGMENGPEWTVDVEWADAAQTTLRLVIRIRPQIGVQSDQPEAVFDFPGCIASYKTLESYEAGKGANSVLAWGDGEGASRLHSDLHLDSGLISSGWCRWENRFTPASGLTDPGQLNLHAAEGLTQMRTGATAWTVQAVASAAPRLGRDWALGDAVRVQIGRSPRHPRGAQAVARVYGWDLDPAGDTVTPILLQED